jgi:Ca-activated chloride channel homolog
MNKPDQPRKAINPTAKRPRTIRQQLEHDAWTNHCRLATRMAGRMARRRRESGAGMIEPGPARNRRSLNRQDRTLLAVSLVLLLLLLFARASMAQESIFSRAAANVQGSDLRGIDLWGIEFRGDDAPQLSVALDTDIKAEITGMVARIDVRQRFRNTGHAWSEAIYRFPLPAGAAVDRLLVDAGGRTVEGEIREKQEAKRRYQQARAEGMVAALVEQQRANQFETRLANIGPGEEITVSISFLTQVDYRDATFSLQIPLTFTPRWDAGTREQAAAGQPSSREPVPAIPDPVFTSAGGPGNAGDALGDHRLTLSIRLHGSMNIASLESRYHDMETHPTLGGYDLYLADPDTRTDRVFQLDWKPDFGTDPEAALMTWEDGEAVYALLMLTPPLVEALAPQARELVFVVDTSGSMEGVSLQQAKAALYQGLGQLEPADRFNLIEFNSDSYLLFEQSQEPSDARLVEAMDFIDDLEADGGTNMQPALAQAMHLPAQPGLLRQIVFITDGSVDHEQELLLQLADELG